MEQLNQKTNDNCATKQESTVVSSRANALKTPLIQNLRITHPEAYRLVENHLPDESRQTNANAHACKACQRVYLQARDRLKRADRDLGETVAMIAASLTTTTAVEAVINIAHDKINLSREFLLATFDVYIVAFLLILVWGAFRSRRAIYRRAQAEKEVDQAKKGIFQFCPGEQWPKTEE